MDLSSFLFINLKRAVICIDDHHCRLELERRCVSPERNVTERRGNANAHRIILEVCAFPLTWIFLALVASSPLIGTISTMTASPANTDAPNSNHRKTIETMICSGQDHSRWMKLVTSLKRWASADIKFTVSPTVDSLRASLDTTKALKKKRMAEREVDGKEERGGEFGGYFNP